MKNNKIFILIYIYIQSINGLPFLFNQNGRSAVEWETPRDNWNITSIPRSVTPHLQVKNFTHLVPPSMKYIDHEAKLLNRLHEIKQNESSRMLWYDTNSDSHYPPLVTKALKLFNLKQVAYELETSVMSKVSCTACKTGN